MRVCLLAPANSTHTQKWTEHLLDKRHELHLITFHSAHINGVHLYPLEAPMKSLYLFHIPKIRLLVKRINPDILHAHYASSYGFVGAALRFHPFVVSVWGSDVVDFPSSSFIHRKMMKHILGQADRVTATSRMLKDITRKFMSPEKTITRIPFGVDLDNFKPDLKKNKRFGITLGVIKKLDRTYGIEYLIRGFALVEKRYRNARLLIAGDGPLLGELKNLACQLGCERKIEFTGKIPHSQVPALLNQMDIFVMPSIRESFGVAALEASACELPVIASNVGGVPEVILDKKTGLLIPPQNPSAIADAILYLIANPDRRKKLGKSGREFVMKNYDWQKNAQRMERLYKEILNRN